MAYWSLPLFIDGEGISVPEYNLIRRPSWWFVVQLSDTAAIRAIYQPYVTGAALPLRLKLPTLSRDLKDASRKRCPTTFGRRSGWESYVVCLCLHLLCTLPHGGPLSLCSENLRQERLDAHDLYTALEEEARGYYAFWLVSQCRTMLV